jgi:hypothetical protein
MGMACAFALHASFAMAVYCAQGHGAGHARTTGEIQWFQQL